MNKQKPSEPKSAPLMRGATTRERLLDAAEALVVEAGLAGLSHRGIARRARVHPGLLHYHFGTIERLVEEVIARRASGLSRALLASLLRLPNHGRCTMADLVRALWAPFADAAANDGGWRNYLCTLARAASLPQGDALFTRSFHDVIAATMALVRLLHPQAADDTIRAGLGHVRALFEREIEASFCGADRPVSAARAERMVQFAAGGFERILLGATPNGHPPTRTAG